MAYNPYHCNFIPGVFRDHLPRRTDEFDPGWHHPGCRPPPPEWVERHYDYPFYPKERFDNRPYFMAAVFNAMGDLIPEPAVPSVRGALSQPLPPWEVPGSLFGPLQPSPPACSDLQELLGRLSDLAQLAQQTVDKVIATGAAISPCHGDTAQAPSPPTDNSSAIFVYGGWPATWDSSAPFASLSLLSPHPIEYGGAIYPTAAHLFFAMKFEDHPAVMAQFTDTPDPEWKGTDPVLRPFMRPDWQQVAQTKLVEVLLRKFDQHPDLAAELIDTGDRPLIEKRPRHNFNLNVVGVALTEVRDMLVHEQMLWAQAEP